MTPPPPPPAPPDFALTLAPAGSVRAGGQAVAVSVRVTPINGFAGSVGVTLSGLPEAATLTPAGTLTVAAGSAATVMVAVPRAVPAQTFTLAARGTSGAVTRDATAPLAVAAASDFSVRVIPAATGAYTARPGGTSVPLGVAVDTSNGFQGELTLTLGGLPSGAATTPTLPLRVTPGQRQDIRVTLPPGAAPGNLELTATATSDTLVRSAAVVLSVLPAIRAFRDGDMLKLERVEGGDSAVAGFRVSWGAAMTELSLNGLNTVNAWDPGREVQISLFHDFFQGCASGCANPWVNWGWNPVQAGDWVSNGSPVTTSSATDTELYSRTIPVEWYPDNKGGGRGRPVATDVVFEQWVSAVPGASRAFRLRYRVTHTGDDTHPGPSHELPALYANQQFNRVAVSGSGTPWTGAAPTFETPPAIDAKANPRWISTERWAAFVDDAERGILLYQPFAYPYASGFACRTGSGGPTGSGCNYLHFMAPRPIAPRESFEFEYYLVVGDLTSARRSVDQIRRAFPVTTDVLVPIGTWDVPTDGATVSGTTTIAGWAIDQGAVSRVDLLIDGVLRGTIPYGGARPDVRAWPGFGPQVGFSGPLDTRTLSPGAHVLEVIVRDAAGNATSFGRRTITVTR